MPQELCTTQTNKYIHTEIDAATTNRMAMQTQAAIYKRKAGGKPPTWLPPGGLVERFEAC